MNYLKAIWRMGAFLAAYYAVSFAAVVPGTPQEVFLRSHPQQSSAPEGIVYQIPDDKLEPGKLYHDASQDKSRMVTRKRVVGSLNQTSAQGTGQAMLGNLKYDVTFRYESTRASKGKGELTWSVNLLDVDVDEALIQSRMQGLAQISSDLYQKAVEYAIERTVAHENQHVRDAATNPVWLYAISSSRDANSNSLLGKSDREMLESLNPELADDMDIQRLKLICMAEARAVFASVRQAAYQLEPLLDMDKQRLSDEEKKEYVPGLYESLFRHNGESIELVKKRMAESTYDKVLDSLDNERAVFELAQKNVLLGGTANIEIDGRQTNFSYKKVYKIYCENAFFVSPYQAYAKALDPTASEMASTMSEYKKNIEIMYALIHAKLYEKNPYKEGIVDEFNQTVTGAVIKREATNSINNIYEWLVEVERILDELPDACSEATCKDDVAAMMYVSDVRKKVAQGQELRNEEKIIYKASCLQKMKFVPFLGTSVVEKDKELLINSLNKRADVLEKFAALISCNFNDNPLLETLAYKLVDGELYGYASKKDNAISWNKGVVPESEDTHEKRRTYKWNHYRQDILNALEKEYMKEVDTLRRKAKRAAERWSGQQ